ncbi:DUF1206 domain-containing protein [Actinoplanes sp. NPDC051851]|uniref:DUF1206 domain-containing protein n=1 Tax=Actinoplanes sp. NPDC051851 TaxID=3154753 RepID=UPI003441408E
MSSTTSHVKYHASRAADSKPLELLARAGFIGYGVIHLLFAWIALQVAFGGSGKESDQSGALQEMAAHSYGEVLLVAIAVGLFAMALWQAFEAAIGESGDQDRTAIAERVVSGVRAVLYGYLGFMAIKVVQGAKASMGDNSESKSAGLMDATGGRWLVGLAGLVVLGVGIGMAVYGLRKKFTRHLTGAPQTVIRLGQAGYSAKGLAYAISGVLFVSAAVTYDPDKARGLDAALKTLAGHPWGVWVLALIAIGIAAFGVYCLAQSRYRKI